MNDTRAYGPKERRDDTNEDVLLLKLHSRLVTWVRGGILCGRFAFTATSALLSFRPLFRFRLFLFLVVLRVTLMFFGSSFTKFLRVALNFGLDKTCTARLNLVIKRERESCGR